jgi:pyruvate,water dikinase
MILWPGQTSGPDRIGMKSWRLDRLRAAGLPVPDWFTIPADRAEAIRIEDLSLAIARLGSGRVAVRSSGIDEDTDTRSYAGCYTTHLNVAGDARVLDAVRDIAHGEGADRLPVDGGESPADTRTASSGRAASGIAVIVQTMLAADAAGVLFTRDPVTGADGFVIEGRWGLGLPVVSGTEIPDHWKIDPCGGVHELRCADKTTRIVVGPEATIEEPVPADRRTAPCLDDGQLARLTDLARQTRDLFSSDQDIEWALAGGQLWLLQARPITTAP